jgi:Beta propeller domain
VRFADDVAYLVTFRQTDPFYTVDLHDPAAPSVVGELKITGYSGYLHPIGDHLVIGVGQEASGQGRVQGSKVSLFDVTDLANPKELAKWTMPGAYTGAEWDHHAFLWWPATKTLVLPITTQLTSIGNTNSTFYGAILLQVDRSGITERGRVSHTVEQPANLGASDCRKVTQEEISKTSGAVPPGGLVLICEAGQLGGAVGYQCNNLSTEQIEGSSPGASLKLPAGGHVEYCYPSWNQPTPVERSLVIGSTLWTLSAQRLQANDLTSLARTARVEL